MSLFAYVGGGDEASLIRLGAMGLQSNADGSIGFGGIVFDNSAGSLTVRGWQEVKVLETDCVEAPLLYKGWIADRTYSRSSSDATYRTATQAFIDCNIVDGNAALAVRLITNPDGKRPAETHNQRINWILGSGSGGLAGLVSDLGEVDATHPRPFQEADYRGQYALDVLNDVAAPIFKTFYVYNDQGTQTLGLFFGDPATTFTTSALTISNVLSDITFSAGVVSGTCYPPSIDAVMHRDPSAVVSKVRYHYRNGVVIENNNTTDNTFFRSPATGGVDLISRDMNVDNDRIGSEASARIMADGLLDKYSSEADTITVTVQLPSTKVGWIDIGQQIGVRFSHLPGYTTLTNTRVVGRNIAQSAGTNTLYDVTLTLNTKGVAGTGGGGSTGPGNFPQPPIGPPSIVQRKFALKDSSGNITLDATPTVGNWLVMGLSARGTSITLPSGWTEHPHGQITPGSDTGRMAYRAVLSTDTAAIHVSDLNGFYGEVWEVSGISGTPDTSSFADVDTGTQPASINAGTMTPTANSPAVLLQFLVMHCSDWAGNGATSMSTPTSWTTDGEYEVTNNGDLHPDVQADSLIVSATSGSYTGSATVTGGGLNFGGWGGLALAFLGTATSNPPVPSQEVPWEVITMSTLNGVSVGTTTHPYADRTLKIKVDGVIITPASYTETDGSCGDFALTWVVDSNEVVQASYDGR